MAKLLRFELMDNGEPLWVLGQETREEFLVIIDDNKTLQQAVDEFCPDNWRLTQLYDVYGDNEVLLPTDRTLVTI